jgi:hypothetical protein
MSKRKRNKTIYSDASCDEVIRQVSSTASSLRMPVWGSGLGDAERKKTTGTDTATYARDEILPCALKASVAPGLGVCTG